MCRNIQYITRCSCSNSTHQATSFFIPYSINNGIKRSEYYYGSEDPCVVYQMTLLVERASDVEKNIIVLEVLGLVKSDEIYEDREKAFMEAIVSGMKVKKGILSKMESLLESYKVVCRELYAAVLG